MLRAIFKKPAPVKKKKKGKLELIIEWVSDPVLAIVISISCSLVMIGFTSGQLVVQYNAKIDNTIQEMTDLGRSLEELKTESQIRNYTKSEIDAKLNSVLAKILVLEEKVKKLEAKE